MFNGNSPSLADIAAVTGNNKDGWGDGNGWWVLIILFAILADGVMDLAAVTATAVTEHPFLVLHRQMLEPQ